MAVTSGSFQDVTGYILAGGKSRRLGVDKRFLKYDGTTLLDRTYRLLSLTLGKEPSLVGDGLALIAPHNYRIIHDKLPERGPLSGLVALLEDCKSDWALVLAVDLPYLSHRELEMLLSSNRSNLDVLTLTQSGEPEPMAALYNTVRLNFWEGRLKNDELSLRSGIHKLKWDVVSLPDESCALQNINNLQDLSELNKL